MLLPIFTLVLLAVGGCSSVVRERLADSSLPGDSHSAAREDTETEIRDVSATTIQGSKGGNEPPLLPSPDDTWLPASPWHMKQASAPRRPPPWKRTST
jgi:hypothetical protein